MKHFPYLRPKVSILVPVFNNESYLGECLASLSAQTLKSLEIILINDGSTSRESLHLLESFQDREKRAFLINKKNTGYGHSLNLGLARARGEYIGIVESDDFIHPQMYEILYRLAKNHDLSVVKSDLGYFIDYQNRRLFARGRVHPVPADYNKTLSLRQRPDLFKSLSLNQPGIYRASFLRRNDIHFNESPGASFQDNGFFFQVFMKAEKLYLYNQALYFLRRDNEFSSVNSRGNWEAIFGEYAFIENLLRKAGELGKTYYPAFIWKKFNSYFFNLRRISPECKEPFLQRFSSEFLAHEKIGDLKLYFFSDSEKADLRFIMADPDGFLKANLSRLQPKEYLAKQKKLADQEAARPEKCAFGQNFEDQFKIPPGRMPKLTIRGGLASLLSRFSLAEHGQ